MGWRLCGKGERQHEDECRGSCTKCDRTALLSKILQLAEVAGWSQIPSAALLEGLAVVGVDDDGRFGSPAAQCDQRIVRNEIVRTKKKGRIRRAVSRTKKTCSNGNRIVIRRALESETTKQA